MAFNGVHVVWGIASLDHTDDEPTDVLVAGLERLAASGLHEVDTARICQLPRPRPHPPPPPGLRGALITVRAQTARRCSAARWRPAPQRSPTR